MQIAHQVVLLLGPPVFYHLQYAKTEGEGIYLYHMSEINVYLGREREEGA